MKEDSGRGYRRVVASPIPQEIVELSAVKKLIGSTLVITCGGGGIPVIKKDNGEFAGVPAVIDKDFAAELLAEEIDVDVFIILTEVEKVALNFNKPNQQDLSKMTYAECEKYSDEGHFAPGSMLPKVQAAMKFVKANPKKKAIISSLANGKAAILGNTGTEIVFE
jgi:carbamate kinase